MPTTAERMRTYHGPAILSYGFRPFFLLGAIWAAFVVAVWLPMLGGRLALPTAFSALEWHVHELVYGYVPAIVAGFLLTAIPNWTGRLPVTGGPLLGLVATWVAGRLAILTSARLGAPLAALVDLLFLACLAGVMAREIVAGRNLRNAKVLVLVALLWVGNAVFHWEAMTQASGGYGLRLGIGVIVFLITLMGGRIIPSFTRNWLVRQPAGRLPTPFGRFDGVCLGAGA
ncbi:MAG TPA: NnrS family protein, partial [Hyphomicrobiaceae bacterium]|nr:NnrS family protein [Hyphomicrobiaceae bacterium]